MRLNLDRRGIRDCRHRLEMRLIGFHHDTMMACRDLCGSHTNSALRCVAVGLFPLAALFGLVLLGLAFGSFEEGVLATAAFSVVCIPLSVACLVKAAEFRRRVADIKKFAPALSAIHRVATDYDGDRYEIAEDTVIGSGILDAKEPKELVRHVQLYLKAWEYTKQLRFFNRGDLKFSAHVRNTGHLCALYIKDITGRDVKVKLRKQLDLFLPNRES